MRNKCFLTLLIISLCFSLPLLSQQVNNKEYRIQSNSKATWTRAAIDPESGTVGFTWTSYQHNKQGMEKTYFSTFYQNNKDEWKTSEPVLLDASGAHSSICFNSKNKEFFLVWSNSSRGTALRAKHFDPRGKELGETIYYNSYLKIDTTPAVAYNSKENTYLLIWYAAKNIPTFPGDGGIMAVVLNGDGAEISERQILRRMVYTRNYFWYTYPLALRFSPKTNRFYLVIRDYEVEDFASDNTRQYYYLYTLSSRAGIYKKSKVNKKSINYESYSSNLDLANFHKKNANNNILIWGDGDSIKYSAVSKTGNINNKLNSIKATAEDRDPAIAYSPEKNNYLVVFSSLNGLKGIHLSSSGKTLESDPFAISSNSKPGQENAKVLWNPALGKYVVFWVDSSLATRDTIYTRFVD